jgi:hypothetical protein
MKAGEHWDYLREYFHKFDTVILVLLVAAVAWFVWFHWKHRVAQAELSVGKSTPPAGQ